MCRNGAFLWVKYVIFATSANVVCTVVKQVPARCFVEFQKYLKLIL